MHEHIREKTQGYLVVWGDGTAGLFDLGFTQLCNSPAATAVTDALSHGVSCVEIITPAELDKKRGYHRPTIGEYLAGSEENGQRQAEL